MNEASLEVNAPDGSCRRIRMTETPYMIGRGEQGNHLPITDDRVSRKCAAITLEGNRYYLEDRGNFRGVFLNGGRISREVLDDGDLITFGAEIPCSLVFRVSDNETSIDNFVSSISDVRKSESSGGLEKLNLLLEATRLLHSDLPLDTV